MIHSGAEPLTHRFCPGARSQSQPPSVTVADPSTSESTRIKPIYPVTATPLLPTSEQVLEWILKSGAAIVDLAKEHVEDLLDLMVFDGDVEKVLVNRLGPDGMPVAARKGGKANGKKPAKKSSSSSKRKKGAESSSSEEDSDDSDTGGGGKGKKGKGGGKRAANGKAKRKRAKLGSDTETESDDDQSSDFDSDAEAPSAAAKRKRRRAQKGSEDDDDGEATGGDSDDGGGRKKKGSSKRRKKRVKRRVKAEGDSDQGISSSESEDESSRRRKRGQAGDDVAAEGGEGQGEGTDGNTQYVYRMIRQYRPTVGWTDMPCGRCPVEEFCSEPPRRRAEAVRRPAQVNTSTGAPSTRIEFEGGIQGIGMLGGAGAAIGVSDAKWGELKGGIGNGVAPVNPVDCPAYKAWLDF